VAVLLAWEDNRVCFVDRHNDSDSILTERSITLVVVAQHGGPSRGHR